MREILRATIATIVVLVATMAVLTTAPIAIVVPISIVAARLADMLRARPMGPFIVWVKTILAPIKRDVHMTFIAIRAIKVIIE